jgi:hypothetical protein
MMAPFSALSAELLAFSNWFPRFTSNWTHRHASAEGVAQSRGSFRSKNGAAPSNL